MKPEDRNSHIDQKIRGIERALERNRINLEFEEKAGKDTKSTKERIAQLEKEIDILEEMKT